MAGNKVHGQRRYLPKGEWTRCTKELVAAGDASSECAKFSTAVEAAETLNETYGVKAVPADSSINIIGFVFHSAQGEYSRESSWTLGQVPKHIATQVLEDIATSKSQISAELAAIECFENGHVLVNYFLLRATGHGHAMAAAPSGGGKKAGGCAQGIGIALVVLFVLFIIGSCLGHGSSSTGSSSTGETTGAYVADTKPGWAPPEGFALAYTTRGNVAFGYRWLKPKEYRCKLGDYCFGMEIVTSTTCDSNFYAQISILDKTGTQIGWTNDTTQTLQAGRKAKLVFSSYEDGGREAQLGETSCY